MTTEEQAIPTPADDNVPKAKVFVGNLSFRTRSKGLREAFEKVGPVEGARVVTQGRRSMGFGFVQFASLEDAQKAVAELHHSDLDERKINVEISTSLNTNLKPPNKRKPRKPRADRPDADGASPSDGSPVEVRPKDGVPVDAALRPPRKPRNPRKPKSETGAPTPGSPTGDASPSTGAATKPRRKRRPAKRAPRPEGSEQEKAERPPRAPRVPRERPVREFSNTVLYVSNLPFSLEDEGLKAEFAEFSPISANVIRRNRNNLSKGFGFVEFAEESQQQAALDAKHKATIGDREITVRKAHIRPPPEATATDAPGQDSTPAAPAESS